MAVDYTITLSDNQKKCMDMVTSDIREWIYNSVKNRARKAQNVIIAANTNHCNENGIAIGVGVTAQITQAYQLGVVKTSAEMNVASERGLE
jgi:hypothetical protein|tara:strand:+ start:336 stop:608 length:273 start_codon:yes stop_codon:yes gene_type:complete